MHNKSWYIEVDGVRTPFTDWNQATTAWKTVASGYLCRANGTLLDCR